MWQSIFWLIEIIVNSSSCEKITEGEPPRVIAQRSQDGGMKMFEFGSLRFRPIEKDDLKLLHGWENDLELMMLSRSKPMSFASMAQLERQYEEWVKDERTVRFMIELLPKKEPVGIAKIERRSGPTSSPRTSGPTSAGRISGGRASAGRSRSPSSRCPSSS